MEGVPSYWFREGLLTEEESSALLAERGRVAQKCTGGAKKPVFLFPDKVVKGPWHLPIDALRLNRELGRSALMRHWALPETECAVLEPALFAHPDNESVYLVTPALYPKPMSPDAWEVESVSRSVSKVGPRILEVISRASTGVIRVSDRVRKEPGYLLHSPEIWEHLIHRCILECGDSGLHNMMVAPDTDKAVGVDLDEMRNTHREKPNEWMTLLFKSPPARKLHPYLQESLDKYQSHIKEVLRRLEGRCFDERSGQILQEHNLQEGNWQERIGWLRGALLAS